MPSVFLEELCHRWKERAECHSWGIRQEAARILDLLGKNGDRFSTLTDCLIFFREVAFSIYPLLNLFFKKYF